jgi:Asp-tRNA(Asn)/Glu-tRNA(Gln) amidotransferase A subunit family amidase
MCGLALPMGLTEGRLPLGLQIAGRPGDEPLTLRIGAALEAAQPKIAWPGLA